MWVSFPPSSAFSPLQIGMKLEVVGTVFSCSRRSQHMRQVLIWWKMCCVVDRASATRRSENPVIIPALRRCVCYLIGRFLWFLVVSALRSSHIICVDSSVILLLLTGWKTRYGHPDKSLGFSGWTWLAGVVSLQRTYLKFIIFSLSWEFFMRFEWLNHAV